MSARNMTAWARDVIGIQPGCSFCKDKLWVCENHPAVAWESGHECCGGAGMPCECNPSGDLPIGHEIIMQVKS